MFENMRVELPNNKFLVVGDMHLNHVTPASRIDNYADTTILKLESLLEIAKREEVKLIIALGDILHKPQQTITYINRVIETMLKFKDAGIELVSCIGNHCIFYDTLEGIEKSALYTLEKAGVMKFPRTVKVADSQWVFRFFAYPEKLVPSEMEKEICVAHRFYENNFTESSITREMCKQLDYVAYIFGHDHVKYNTINLDFHRSYPVKVIRPGSFTRGTSHQYNLETTLTVKLITLGEGFEIDEEDIPIYQQPANQVFTEGVLHKKEITSADLSDSFKELMASITKVETGSDLGVLFNEIDMPEEVKLRLTEYFRTKGIYL